jgi:small subunit ribosomal protein S16
MAVKIRLKRMGKKKQPTYRVIVADARSPRDGRFIESIGRYDPHSSPSIVEIDGERAQYWLGNGAQPTERVRKLLEIAGAVRRPKVSRSGIYRLDDAPVPGSDLAQETEVPTGSNGTGADVST